MRSLILGTTLFVLSFAALAEEATPQWYVAGMASHVQPDADRDMRNGLGGAALFGKPIGNGINLEAEVFGHSFRRHDEDAEGSKAYGAGIDVAYVPRAKHWPFVIAGVGGVHEEGFAPYARAGIGVHIPNFYEGFSGPLSTRRSTWSLRVDLSWYGAFTDRVNLDERRLDDVRLNIGIQFNRVAPRVLPPPPPPPAQEPIIKATPEQAPPPPPEETPPVEIIPPWYVTHPK